MKPKDLLLQLSYMESLLENFSYEELESQTALKLKNAFDSFSLNLEEKILRLPVQEKIPSILEKKEENKGAFSEEDIVRRDTSKLRMAKPQLLKNIAVLVFEDSLLSQRLVEHRLKSWGCKVYLTDNAQYGINILETEKIDVVLMDLAMPVMDGYEISEIIRQSKNIQVNSVPIIAFTSYFTDQDKQRCADFGIEDFILKPFDQNELWSKLVENAKRKIK